MGSTQSPSPLVDQAGSAHRGTSVTMSTEIDNSNAGIGVSLAVLAAALLLFANTSNIQKKMPILYTGYLVFVSLNLSANLGLLVYSIINGMTQGVAPIQKRTMILAVAFPTFSVLFRGFFWCYL